ncbi:peptidoglycan D,D-transpeptidase FtsI family protein [Streptacidiphilus sp. MAP5-3]|uniref:peptidoglycan D,D-transpeptidase FtsI family protein n=1 Tax=unclassified Streptacidiphilus TaxID=2643834 RepID=UPI003511BCBE
MPQPPRDRDRSSRDRDPRDRAPRPSRDARPVRPARPSRPDQARRPAAGSGGVPKARAAGAGSRGNSANGSRNGSGGGHPRPPVPRAGARGPAGAATLQLGEPRKRLRFLLIALGTVFALFLGRLVQLQFLDSTALAAEASANRYVTVPLTAQRGAITDGNGNVLATTVTAYDITADPTMLTPQQLHTTDGPRAAAALLAPILGMDQTTLTTLLTAKNPTTDMYRLIAKQQSPQVWTQISNLSNQLANSASSGHCLTENLLAQKAGDSGRVDDACANPLASIFRARDDKRVYPEGDLAANVIGFVNAAGVGSGGLEEQFQSQLRGTDGNEVYAQANGREVPTAEGQHETAAIPGSNIKLTLNSDIQWEAQQQLSAQVAASHALGGYVIVQDVTNGRILAMATAPTFNPNDLAHADPNAIGNTALSDAYEPGSVSKLMTMSAVIQQNVATPQTHVTVPGALPRDGTVFHDDVAHGTEQLTLNGVLAQSSNIGTILAAEHLGSTQAQANQVLYDYLTKFGIGQPSGLNFPGESPGILPPPGQWNASQQYTIPFGQGLSVNALQTTSVYSTIANGGVRVAPTLVEGITGPDGVYTPAPAPATTRVVSTQTARTVAQMLQSVVGSEEGTGTMAQIPGYLVAGKTGTANRATAHGYSGYTASFIGFAPADKPRITVSCVIQGPVGAHYGGELCGPVFKQVMEFSLKTLDVPPTGGAPADLPVNW